MSGADLEYREMLRRAGRDPDNPADYQGADGPSLLVEDYSDEEWGGGGSANLVVLESGEAVPEDTPEDTVIFRKDQKNLYNTIILGATDEVPVGTPPNTIILRTP